MQILVRCPTCEKKGLRIELNNGYRVVTTGRALKDFPMITRCSICKRAIRYDVVKDERE